VDEHLPRALGPYLCLARLGAGAAGAAYLARPLDPARGVPTPFVLKRLHASVAESSEFVARFRHEAEVAVAVDSPHVAAVFDVGQVGPELYIAMEYVPGWTLGRLVFGLERRGQQAPVPVVHALISQTLAGLSALHDARDPAGAPLHAVHRDVSPKNVMVGEDGRARVIDLGLMKSSAQSWQTVAGRIMGSPGYMAPEQIRGRPVDRRADLFAVGTILFELLTATRFIAKAEPLDMLRAALAVTEPPTPSARRPGLSAALDAVVRRGMALDAPARFRDAATFQAALEEAAGPPASRDEVQAFLRSFLGPEFETRRREVAALVAQPWAEPDEDTQVLTQVFVRRPGIAPESRAKVGALTRVVGTPLVPPAWPGPGPEAGMASLPVSQGVLPPPRAARWAAGLVVAAAVGLGLAGGAWWVGRAGPAPAPPAGPAAVPRAEAVAAPVAAPRVEAPSAAAEPAAEAPARVPSRPRSEPPRPEPRVATPPRVAAPAAADPAARVEGLYAAAVKVKASLPQDDLRRGDMDRLLTRLTLLKAAGPQAASEALLDGLEAELARLRGAP
jgi:hypothetical protein